MVEKIVKEYVKEVVPTEQAQTQTDIAMDYFDRERSMPKAESRASTGSKTRVGGGGTIAKPPRQPSKQGSQSRQSLNEPLNVAGAGQQQPSEGSRRSKKSAHSGDQNAEQPLPNLLTNSRGNIQASRKSLMEPAAQQPSEGG